MLKPLREADRSRGSESANGSFSNCLQFGGHVLKKLIRIEISTPYCARQSLVRAKVMYTDSHDGNFYAPQQVQVLTR